MSNNQKLFAIISGLTLFITYFLYLAALEHALWKEFWISLFAIVFAGAVSGYLLKEKDSH